jgi:hypothetical protein
MNSMIRRPLFIVLALQACDVPVIRPNEVGVDCAAISVPGCPCGLAVADTNRSESANIALASLTGWVLSPSIISSASHTPGLSASLGGDVVFPSTPSKGDELVLLDRYPKGVLTWINITTPRPQVRAQISVATGYVANPHDYVPLTPNKAYVTRFDPNSNAGREAFDGGSDILIVDPSVPAITGRIDLPAIFPPSGNLIIHPDRARHILDHVYVVLPLYDRPYSNSGQGYLAVIDPKTDSVVQGFPLAGLSGCSGLAVAPNVTSIAVVCSGHWQGSTTANNATSGIVGLRLSPSVSEIWRIPANVVGNRAFGFEVAFVDSTHVLATQLGELGPPIINDAAFVVDIATGTSTRVLESANAPVTLSVGPCNSACGACFIADAGRNRLYNLSLTSSGKPSLTGYSWADPTGLPPTSLAFF